MPRKMDPRMVTKPPMWPIFGGKVSGGTLRRSSSLKPPGGNTCRLKGGRCIEHSCELKREFIVKYINKKIVKVPKLVCPGTKLVRSSGQDKLAELYSGENLKNLTTEGVGDNDIVSETTTRAPD